MSRCQWKLFLITSIFLTSVISTSIIETIISQLCQQGFGNDIVFLGRLPEIANMRKNVERV